MAVVGNDSHMIIGSASWYKNKQRWKVVN